MTWFKPGAASLTIPDRPQRASSYRAKSSSTPSTPAAKKVEIEEAALAVHQEKISEYIKNYHEDWQQKEDDKLHLQAGYDLPTFDANAPRGGTKSVPSRFDTMMAQSTAQPQEEFLSEKSAPSVLVQKIVELEEAVHERDLALDALQRENQHLKDMLEVSRQHGLAEPGLVPDQGSDFSSPGARERAWAEEAAEASRIDRERAKLQEEYEHKMAMLSSGSSRGRPSPANRMGAARMSPEDAYSYGVQDRTPTGVPGRMFPSRPPAAQGQPGRESPRGGWMG